MRLSYCGLVEALHLTNPSNVSGKPLQWLFAAVTFTYRNDHQSTNRCIHAQAHTLGKSHFIICRIPRDDTSYKCCHVTRGSLAVRFSGLRARIGVAARVEGSSRCLLLRRLVPLLPYP